MYANFYFTKDVSSTQFLILMQRTKLEDSSAYVHTYNYYGRGTPYKVLHSIFFAKTMDEKGQEELQSMYVPEDHA